MFFFSKLVDINEFSHQISDINEKIDYVITNIKQINTINKFQLNNGLSTITATIQNELTNELTTTNNNNNNISLSSNMFKSLMQCKQCLEQFSLTKLPKRAIKCGHSICSKCFDEEKENEEQTKNNNQNDINNETILINCPICNLKSIWTNNLDLITILQEVHRNKMDNFIKDIIKINSSKLSENYSNNFKDLIKIALNDFDKLSSDSQILIYNIIKRKYNKECQINANPSNKRPRFN